MKTINIYLTKEEQKLCRAIQNKYRVSLSTLCDKVCFFTYKYLKQSGKDNSDPIFNEYTGKGYKTSIKPKCLINQDEYLYMIFANERNRNVYATNCLKIYVNKAIKNHINAELVQNYWADIDRELQKTNDPTWDYNRQMRTFVRIYKKNKEYFKRFD